MTPSATAYALLGLLSLRPWTTYELAQQARRSLRWFFPRAERHLYTQAKRLAAAGLATAEVGYRGRRRTTTYTITPAGRRALRGWLHEPPAPPVLECEALLRTFFADAGSRDDLVATLEATRSQAADALEQLAAMARETVAGDAEFLERIPVNGLSMRLGLDFYRTVHRWATWAADEVATWQHPDGRGWDGGLAVFQDAAGTSGPAAAD
jgi:PadR family transcriptional regulator AphA